jgi:hypothetical protein
MRWRRGNGRKEGRKEGRSKYEKKERNETSDVYWSVAVYCVFVVWISDVGFTLQIYEKCVVSCFI